MGRRRGGLPKEARAARRHREAYFPTQNPFGPHLVPSAVQSELDEQSVYVFLQKPSSHAEPIQGQPLVHLPPSLAQSYLVLQLRVHWSFSGSWHHLRTPSP